MNENILNYLRLDNIKYLILNDTAVQLIIYLLGVGVCLAVLLILIICLMDDNKP